MSHTQNTIYEEQRADFEAEIAPEVKSFVEKEVKEIVKNQKGLIDNVAELLSEKQREYILDVTTSDKVSNCCSAKVYAPTDEWTQCMDCKEYCDAV